MVSCSGLLHTRLNSLTRRKVLELMKRPVCLLLASILLATGMLSGCSTEKQSAPTSALSRFQGSFLDVFDTVTQVVVYAENDAAAKEIVDEVHAELLTCHQLFDIYNDYDGINNLKTINDHAGVSPVTVDERILDLLEYAAEMDRATDGSMNVALGSVLRIWHNYREAGIDDPEHAQLPPMEELEAASRHTSIDSLVIDRSAGTVYLSDPDMLLDVGAIAKGYAAQLVIDALRKQGVENLLLSIGGNVCAIGGRADGTPWKVGIQSPDMQGYLCTVGMENLNLVTSGSYQRYYTVEGRTYHHIIDPATLMPADHFVSVSVLCNDSGLADVLSTALFVLPLAEGKALVKAQEGVEAMWLDTEGNTFYSDGFEQYILPDS